MKKPAWSYSLLTSFEQCPKRYFHVRVAKDVPDPPGEAAKWGTEVHKHLELRVTDNTPLPQPLEYLEPMMSKILATPHDEIHAERQYCFNQDFQEVTWFSKEAWCRSVVDLELRKGDKALILDHKTGKRKPDSDQLRLFAAVVMTADESLNRVTTGFLWLKDNRIDKETYTRDDVAGIWQDYLARVARLEAAFESNKWVPKPSGLCKAWCPVGKKRCQYCGKD